MLLLHLARLIYADEKRRNLLTPLRILAKDSRSRTCTKPRRFRIKEKQI